MEFAKKAMTPVFVAQHSFSPLIHYFKPTKKYKKEIGKTKRKDRPIMYASHRDACILSFYSNELNIRLNEYYQENDLYESVIAYRSLGQANYDFSAEAYNYASNHSPCIILAFDVSGFFDHLDHALLKTRLKKLLKVETLSDDWYKVFKSVTKYHYIKRSDLKKHPTFKIALEQPGIAPIARVADIKAANISFHPNEKKTAGIPQGTPISASFSNLYMMDFDLKMQTFCQSIGALYRRYSDDILIVCRPKHANQVEVTISRLTTSERLELSAEKTERTNFDPTTLSALGPRSAQYLGFNYYPGGAGIRPGSLARQWRKMRRSLRRTRKKADAAIANGKATKLYTKKLRRQFSPLQFRNFSSYARRSAVAFGKGEKITKQVKRLERAFEYELRKLQERYKP